MFLNRATSTSTGPFSAQIEALGSALEGAEAIVVGAGAGLSAAAGFSYAGERFEKHFSDFYRKYGIRDMYSGGFYPFETLEEYWAWWSRQILLNRYDCGVGQPYQALLELVRDKDYFVLTTNVDHQFQRSGFDKGRLFYTQGDYGLWQCSKPCHQKTYGNEAQVRQMCQLQQDMKIPPELVPRCPVCGAPMTMNLRIDDTFVQDDGWYAAARRYEDFLGRHQGQRVLFLELGVGANTPGIIKYPFWRMTAQNPNAVYACVNSAQALCPGDIRRQAVLVQGDIRRALEALRGGGTDVRRETTSSLYI